MPFLPDPGELRAVAARIEQHAHATRRRAERLGAATAAARWQGLAAAAFEAQAHGVISGLRGSAGRLDDAAGALRRHADRIGRLLGLMENVAGVGLAGVEELLSSGTDLVGSVLDLVGL